MATYGQLQSHIDNDTGDKVDTKGSGGALHVTELYDPVEGEFRIAVCAAGTATALVPGAAVSITSTDIPVWTFGSGYRNLALFAGRDNLSTNTNIGWWVTWNAGSVGAAFARLSTGVGTAMAKYASGAAVDGDNNKAGIIVPFGVSVVVKTDADITDAYIMPLSQAANSVGYSVLTAVLS